MAEKSDARRGSSESNDPLLTKLSTTRRLTARRSTRSQKSKSEVKRPVVAPRRSESGAPLIKLGDALRPPDPPALAASTASTAPSPTFLIAASPKRQESQTTVKNMPESFTSGG